jgi:eukaryotic-like serine/threonine-protein kinase
MRDPLIGSRINRYEIREAIRRSDLIGVYRAYDTKLERDVLLKTILHSADYSQEARDFFLAEVRTLGKLTHDNIVKVLDFGSENGNLYLISEYVSGNTLSDLMSNPIPWNDAINILLPIADALIYAHSRGVIHRDLRPDNILIDADKQPILSDFSLVRIIEDEETRDMTGTNLGLGSAGYISPEQGQGLSVDFRSDIYSLGVIFYEMVTGKRLFYAASSMEVVLQHIMTNPPRPRKIVSDLPRSVEAIILKALSKDPDKRYQSTEEFSIALKAIAHTSTGTGRRISRQAGRMIAAFGAAGALVLLGLALTFSDSLIPEPAEGIPSEQSSVTPTITPGMTSTPSAKTFTPEPAASGPAMSTPDAFSSVYDLPPLPVVQDAQLPVADEAISLRNVQDIRELARWGKPEITEFAFINDDRTLLAATSAGLYYLDPKDVSARYLIDGEGILTALSVSEDEKWVATGDSSGSVRIWDTINGRMLYQLKGNARITALTFSPDRSQLVFSDADNNIHLWNPAMGKEDLFPKRHGRGIHSLIFSSSGDLIYSGSYDFQILIWGLDGKTSGKLTTNKMLNDIALSSDNRYLVAAMNDSTIGAWDLAANGKAKEISLPSLATDFTSIAFLPNDDNFITGSKDGYVRFWSLSGGPPLWETLSTQETGTVRGTNQVRTLAISDSGLQFAVMLENGMVDIWNTATRQIDASRDWHSAPIEGMAISPDDEFLAYQLGDRFVEVMSIKNSDQLTRISGTIPRGNPISSENKMVVVQSLQPDLLGMYSLPITPGQQPMPLYEYPVNGLVNFSPDSTIVAAFSNKNLNYWSTSSGLELRPGMFKNVERCQAIYRADDTFVVVGSENGVLFSDANLPYFCRIPRNPRSISEAFLPDGSIIVQSLSNQLVEVWNLQNGDQKVQTKTQAAGDVQAVAISSDGKLLAVASESGVLEVYDLKSMQLLKILQLRTGSINQVLFSKSGEYIITGSSDGTLRFFGLHR